MVSVTQSLLEARSKRFIRGAWISPDGETFFMPSGNEHNEWLDDNLPYQRLPNGESNHSLMMRVVRTYDSPSLLYGNRADEQMPTSRQLKALKDLGIELGLQTLLLAKEVMKKARVVYDPNS